MAIHCQLLFATILYVLVFISSIITISTIAYSKSNLHGFCYLYVTKNVEAASMLPCSINLYACGGAAVYGGVMAIYHGYGTIVASRESHIGRTMWVMPWLLLNSLVMVLVFICSCIYSVGIHITCSHVDKTSSGSLHCSVQKGAYLSIVIAETSLWISSLLWICLMGIEVIRLMRNRRAISREVYVEPNASDVVSIANVVSTA